MAMLLCHSQNSRQICEKVYAFWLQSLVSQINKMISNANQCCLTDLGRPTHGARFVKALKLRECYFPAQTFQLGVLVLSSRGSMVNKWKSWLHVVIA